MVVFDQSAALKRELEPLCKSPKPLRLLPGFTTRQALVSLLALALGLVLLLRQHPGGYESPAWKPNPVMSLVISGLDDTAAVSQSPNLNHSLSPGATPAAAEGQQDNLKNTSGAVCDLTKGSWVRDENRPLYSGEFCGNTLSIQWYCRRDEHRNLSYEQYRWQPFGCDLPAFDAAIFLRRMRNKTIAFVGDSLGRQQFQSLICMLTSSGRVRISDVSRKFKLQRGSAAYKFLASNTTILYYWSATLAEEEERPDGSVFLHLDRVPLFLRRHIAGLNLVVVNTGHHWNRGKMKLNRWLPHLDGEPVRQRMTMANYRQKTLDNCARWLSAEAEKRNGELQVFVRSLSPRHFRGGEWDSGGRCDNLEGTQQVEHRVDWDVESAARERMNVRVLEVGFMSRMRGEAHIGQLGGDKSERQDCLHWCLPGVPDAWNELMFGLYDTSLG